MVSWKTHCAEVHGYNLECRFSSNVSNVRSMFYDDWKIKPQINKGLWNTTNVLLNKCNQMTTHASGPNNYKAYGISPKS